jgi:hypothetical protein
MLTDTDSIEAYAQASETRETATSSLNDLTVSFEIIDLSFRSYPEDENILQCSISLVLAVFKAIEAAVKFYTSSQGKCLGIEDAAKRF